MKLSVDGEVIDPRESPLTLVSRRKRGESWEFEARRGAKRLRWWATALPGGAWAITTPGGERRVVQPQSASGAVQGPYGPIKSPMAGVLTRLAVTPGQAVEAGEELAVIEAMKMRYAVVTPVSGVVAEVGAVEGARVAAGQALLVLSPAP